MQRYLPLTSSLAAEVIGQVAGGLWGFLTQPGIEKQMRGVGAIPQDDVKKIHAAFSEVIEAMITSLKDTGSNPVLNAQAEQLRVLMIERCLPVLHDKKFAHIPQVRTSVASQFRQSVTGRQEEVGYIFDAYYKEKQGVKPNLETDKPVAIVQIWDNLVYVILSCLNELKEQPGEDAKKAMAALEVGLQTLVMNAQINDVMQERAFKWLSTEEAQQYLPRSVTRQKRDRVLEELNHCAFNIFAEAKKHQQDLTVRASVEALTQEVSKQADQMSEFFLRALGTSLRGVQEPAILSMLAKGESRVDVTAAANQHFTNESIGKIVQRAAHVRLAILSQEEASVHGKESTFNDLLRQGVLDVVGAHSDKNDIEHAVAQVLNLQNLAVALGEDLRRNLEEYGSQGMLASGELQVRQAIIRAVYQRSIQQFKAVLQHPRFNAYLHELQNLDTVKSTTVKLNSNIAAFLGCDVSATTIFIKDDSPEHRVLTSMVNMDHKVQDTSAGLQQQVTGLVRAGSEMPAIQVESSGLYFYHIALLCAHDPLLEGELLGQVASVKPTTAAEGANYPKLRDDLTQKLHMVKDLKTIMVKNKRLIDGKELALGNHLQWRFNVDRKAIYALVDFDSIHHTDDIVNKAKQAKEIKASLVKYKQELFDADATGNVQIIAGVDELIPVVEECGEALRILSEGILTSMSNSERYEAEIKRIQAEHARQYKLIAERLGESENQARAVAEKLQSAETHLSDTQQQVQKTKQNVQEMRDYFVNDLARTTREDIDQIHAWRANIAEIRGSLSTQSDAALKQSKLVLNTLQRSMDDRIKTLEARTAKRIAEFQDKFGVLEKDLSSVHEQIGAAKREVAESAAMVRTLLQQIETLKWHSRALAQATSFMSDLTTSTTSTLRSLSFFSSYQDAKVEYLAGLLMALLQQGAAVQQTVSHEAFKSQIRTAMESEIGTSTHFFSKANRLKGGQDLTSVVARVIQTCETGGADALKGMLMSPTGLNYRGCIFKLEQRGDKYILTADGKGASRKLRVGVAVDLQSAMPTRRM